jgi:hypothetical protein
MGSGHIGQALGHYRPVGQSAFWFFIVVLRPDFYSRPLWNKSSTPVEDSNDATNTTI